MSDDLIKRILSAPVYDVAIQTPIHNLETTSGELDCNVFLKREDLQPVHSFKLRGAYNKIAHLSDAQKKKGVIAVSAGNHAQGVALSCQVSQINATIIMPETTPAIKVKSVKRYGAKVVLYGDTYDEAAEYAKSLTQKTGAIFVHPYDDLDVIAGQGTIAKEIIDNMHDGLDYVFIPVGGGGLLAGMAVYLKSLSPKTKIIAVEHEGSACLHAALQGDKRVVLPTVDIFADGVAVKQIGEWPFKLCKSLIDGVVLVDTDEICSAIKDIYNDVRAISEPAGAMSLAGIKKYVRRHHLSKKQIMGVLCGANVNFHRLRHISERAEIGERSEGLFCVQIPEKKGSFLRFCKQLKGRSITEFNYRYNDTDEANVFVGVQLTESEPDTSRLKASFKTAGYRIDDLSDNEVAKLHIRYMVGGKSAKLTNELLYRFQFPERPGALLHFLTELGTSYNITLFHYRNHGAAFGRVLVGIDVNADAIPGFHTFLSQLGYTYFDETSNIAYRQFL